MTLDDYVCVWDVCRISDYIGLLGVVLVLVCYFLLQFGFLSLKSFTFSFLNFVGSILLLFSLMYHWNLASVVIEVVWLLISLFGVIRFLIKRKKTGT